MNWDQIKNDWKAVSDSIKLTWGKLSDDDLAQIAGQRDQLVTMLQKRYGYATVVAQNKVDELAEGNDR